MIILNIIAGLVAMVVMVHVIFYFINSFSVVLPWTHCDNSWNTANFMVYSNESGKVDALVDFVLTLFIML